MFALVTASDRSGQLTWATVFIILGSVAAIALFLWLLERFFPASNKYRTAGNALVRLDAFFHPASEHVIEAKEHEEREDNESGGPPTI
jgi:hypothetical protein